ncbi:MAG: transposase family protein [Prevotella aurantiaca]|nr:transposase family protein [Prevotella aurantiaca]
MNSSFLYHAWGLYTHECTCEEYKGNRIILYVQTKERIRCCPCCGARSVVKNGYRLRDFVGLPIGGKRVTIRSVKGDAINVLLAAAAYNFKRAMRVLLDLIKRISIELVNTSFMLKYCF